MSERALIGKDLAGYYRLHAPLYDLTRPFFLFGRRRLLRTLVGRWHGQGGAERAPRILEVGCGTGSNLAWLKRVVPRAQLVGLDLAPAMLERARKRLGNDAFLAQHALGRGDTLPAALAGGFDLIVLSYMLSMTGAARANCIADATALLRPGGLLGVVDFWSTPSAAFARWMGRNHVRFEDRPEAALEAVLRPVSVRVRSAYGGWWRYAQWVGTLEK